MRLCRFSREGRISIGLYCDDYVIPLAAALRAVNESELAKQAEMAVDLVDWLPPDNVNWNRLKLAHSFLQPVIDQAKYAESDTTFRIKLEDIELLPPIALPRKLLLLAGNYVEHVKEQGDLSAEREQTFPYVFSKPPSTTMIGSRVSFQIPTCSPSKIDYELELAVVIGQRCRDVSAEEALRAVAGYSVINDISDRGFRPNPSRTERPRDKFFDWLHGKWHDGSCPCGPCITTSDDIADPNKLSMKLSIDGEVRQNANTDQMVFSVGEVIAFISRFVTLEPGDILSTGTPAGVGNATGRFLQPGQKVKAWIEKIGTLETSIT